VQVYSDRKDNETIRVAVKDSGIGLDSQQVEKLFEAFHTTKTGRFGNGPGDQPVHYRKTMADDCGPKQIKEKPGALFSNLRLPIMEEEGP